MDILSALMTVFYSCWSDNIQFSENLLKNIKLCFDDCWDKKLAAEVDGNCIKVSRATGMKKARVHFLKFFKDIYTPQGKFAYNKINLFCVKESYSGS